MDVYSTLVAPLIEEVIAGYNCTVFAYGQTGTGKTHTIVGTECAELRFSWEDDSDIGIIPRALSHLFDELRLLQMEFSMRISYLELYNEELCDLLSSDDNTKIRIFDDSTKKGSVIIQGLEEVPVHQDDVYKLLEKGKDPIIAPRAPIASMAHAYACLYADIDFWGTNTHLTSQWEYQDGR